jgi:hypothetical protein
MRIQPIDTGSGPGLVCDACGDRMTLNLDMPRTEAMRPWVEVHRHCELPALPHVPTPRKPVRMQIDLVDRAHG